ncbi:hypothetical protein KM92DES2_10212 [uncultured Desulfovibrio sp.]|uniref:Uncharacterized protein n=1 Tax=uncultured Desulfovibrio sp. TaxID=167968 RepID=A0A212IXS8_9BACT|nr:hypothetical protein KM92DES2_10212 [uncultured Desulfovibrio sp.]
MRHIYVCGKNSVQLQHGAYVTSMMQKSTLSVSLCANEPIASGGRLSYYFTLNICSDW